MWRWRNWCCRWKRSSTNRRMGTVLALADRRISLADALPLPPASPVLEVVFIGCCPTGQLDAAAQRAVRELGFTPTTDGFDQPVPVDDWGTFRALFGAMPVPP